VSLKSEGSSTRLSYSAKASVGGKLAQVGSRLIDGDGEEEADDFFTAFNEKLAGAPGRPTRRVTTSPFRSLGRRQKSIRRGGSPAPCSSCSSPTSPSQPAH